MMKKYFLSFAVMMMGATLLTGCLDNDDNKGNNQQVIAITSGAYVINNGQWNKNNGSMTFVSNPNGSYTNITAQQVLSGASGLGDTPNDAVTVGDSIFIVGSTENTIFLVNKNNPSTIVDRVSTTEVMGEAEGYNPRHITYYNGKIYFTTYGGYVGVIDVKSFSNSSSIQKYKVGSAPEGVTIGGSSSEPYLYVCNSDYGYGNASISKISLTTGAIEEIKNEKIMNPQEIVVDGSTIYFIDWGWYDENWAQHDNGLYRLQGSNATQLIPSAYGMGVGLVYYGSEPVGYGIVTFNTSYGSSEISYSRLNTYTGTVSPLNLSGDTGHEILSPAAVGVDPLTGYIYIASRQMENGYSSLTLPGYMNVYNSEGQYIENSTVTTGIEPHKIGFTYGTTTITY